MSNVQPIRPTEVVWLNQLKTRSSLAAWGSFLSAILLLVVTAIKDVDKKDRSGGDYYCLHSGHNPECSIYKTKIIDANNRSFDIGERKKLNIFLMTPDQLNILLFGAALISTGVGVLVRKISIESIYIINDYIDISDQQRTNWLYQAMEPTADSLESIDIELPVMPQQPELFDWAEFDRDYDKYPHILVLGGSGDGKSCLGYYLANILEGNSFLISPHKKPDDFPNISSIRGTNRNYNPQRDKGIGVFGTVEDDIPEFLSLVNGFDHQSTVAGALMSIYNEMMLRLEAYNSEQNAKFDQYNIIIDEANSILESLDEKSIINAFLIPMILQCRKVGIRFIFLCHDAGVKALKLEGRSSVRKSLTFIYLRSFLWSKRGYIGIVDKLGFSEGEILWLKNQKYIAVVESTPAVIGEII